MSAYCTAPNCTSRLDQGQGCSGDNQCKSGHCADGLCCDSDCGGKCQRCNLGGTPGTCTNIPIGQDPDGECGGGGNACNGSGACANPEGNPCGADGDCLSAQCEDGVCCNLDCPGLCKRCDITVGTCTNVPSGQTVTGCNAVQACDGSGNCKKANGQTCATGTDCASNNCVDTYCCDTACSGLCRSCNGADTVGGQNGKCDFIKSGQDPANECSAACNGSGACQP
jgi:hypothetical protein